MDNAHAAFVPGGPGPMRRDEGAEAPVQIQLAEG